MFPGTLAGRRSFSDNTRQKASFREVLFAEGTLHAVPQADIKEHAEGPHKGVLHAQGPACVRSDRRISPAHQTGASVTYRTVLRKTNKQTTQLPQQSFIKLGPGLYSHQSLLVTTSAKTYRGRTRSTLYFHFASMQSLLIFKAVV